MVPEHATVRETYLSRPPSPTASLVPALTLAAVTIVSALEWRGVLGADAGLAAIPRAVIDGQELWRLYTALFVHADLPHLVGNALPLAVFSYLLFSSFGAAVYPLGTVLLAGITNLIVLFTYAPDVRLVGASGAVYLMAGFWLVSYLGIERRYLPGVRLVRCLGFALVVLLPTTLEPNVSYRTHAVGFAVGAVAGALHFLLRRDEFRAAEIVDFD